MLIQDLFDRISAKVPVTDLRNVQVEFTVTRGDGAVIIFTSSLDNGTADQLMRFE